MKNVLISGGAGFIGSHLGAALCRRGYNVTVLDNLSPQVHGSEGLHERLSAETRFVRADVRSRDEWRAALEGQQVVVHLAAETGTGQSMYEIERYVDVNVRGTANLLDSLANERHSVGKIVVASSRAVYGEGKYRCDEHGFVYPAPRNTVDMQAGDFAVKCPRCNCNVIMVATDEESALHPSSIYGISKHAQEQLCMTAGRSLGIPAIALRYQNVYGPGQSLLNPYTGIISIFSTRVRNGAPIVIFEDGQESRDFVYIDDAVEATVLAIESAATGVDVFNVGSGVRTDVMSVAQALLKTFGGSCPIRVSGEFRAGDIRGNVADISKANRKLGFQPKVDFETGIGQFAAWASEQIVPADRLDSSIDEMRRKGLFK